VNDLAHGLGSQTVRHWPTAHQAYGPGGQDEAQAARQARGSERGAGLA